MGKLMKWDIPEEKLARWLVQVEENNHDEVRLEICTYLMTEANRAGRPSVANCFESMTGVYTEIKDNHVKDGTLNYFNECARIGCDTRLKAMVRYFDENAAREIGRII